MPKITLEIDDFEYKKLEILADQNDFTLEKMGEKLLASMIVTSTFQGKSTIKQESSCTQDIFDELKEIMVAYQITQLDMASYLKISQTAVSLYLSAKKENALIKKHLDQIGVEKFLLKVFIHKFNLIQNSDWSIWKNVLFSYILSVKIDVSEESLKSKVDQLDENIENRLLDAEENGIEAYIDVLEELYLELSK